MEKEIAYNDNIQVIGGFFRGLKGKVEMEKHWQFFGWKFCREYKVRFDDGGYSWVEKKNLSPQS